MSYLTNRRTGNIFRTLRSRKHGKYLDEIIWLKDHGYVYFNQEFTPDQYIVETWIDNYGNLVRFKIDRPSGTSMTDATIVDSRYIPAQ